MPPKGRKHKHKHHSMPTLQSILAEVQNLDTTELENFEAAKTQIVNDLTTLINATPATPAADPIVTITTATQSGVTAVFIPQS